MIHNDQIKHVVAHSIDGGFYTGRMQNDLPNGKGKMVYPDGWTYEGEWQNGVLNGVATVTDANNNSLTGKYTNGIIRGYACFKNNHNGFSYRLYDNQGQLKDNNVPKETIEDLKRFYVGYSYL